jgi:hypothetical protein
MSDEADEGFELPRWCPDPLEGESIASYLVRFRSQEVSAMSTMLVSRPSGRREYRQLSSAVSIARS